MHLESYRSSHVAEPWVVVGSYICDALKEEVATEPSLPALPENLYSAPDERSASDEHMTLALD